MKIGTVTFWHSKENYGAMLQCYALVRYLNKQGHEAKLLRIKAETGRDLKYPKLFRISNMIYALIHPQSFKRLKYKMKKKHQEVVERGFGDFLERNIPAYPHVYTFDEINTHPVDAEVLICGSDQIWSGVSRTYFLQMCGQFKRISYAASFGGAKYENPYATFMVKKWLKTFDLVTVREEEGLETCERLGIRATLALDPTLLLDREDYENLCREISHSDEKPYIFLYLLGKEISIDVKDIFEFAKREGIDVKYVASQGRSDEYEKLYPTVEEWIALIRDAKYVITNSFHGTVFSMIFNKPFLTFPIVGESERMNGRIQTLLGRSGMKDRIYNGNLSVLFQPVKFDTFINDITARRSQITSLLQDAIVK